MDTDGNFVTKHDSAPSTHFFQHIREFYLSLLWRGNMTESFLSSGKFLCMALMYRESGFALKISCWKLSHSKFRTSNPWNSRLSPQPPPVFKHFLFRYFTTWTRWYWSAYTEWALLSSSYLIVVCFSHIYVPPLIPLPFGKGLPGGKVTYGFFSFPSYMELSENGSLCSSSPVISNMS